MDEFDEPVGALGVATVELLAALQPAKEMGKNFAIDIESLLNKFLVELLDSQTQATQTGIDEHSVLNFAKVAMVLQKSSFVYSRKVDHLAKLVFKTLHDIRAFRESNKKGGLKSHRKGGNAHSDVFFEELNNDEFLPLDDLIPLGSESVTTVTGKNDRASIDPRSSVGTTRFSMTEATMNERSVASINRAAYRDLVGSLDQGCLRLVGGVCDSDQTGSLRMPGVGSDDDDLTIPLAVENGCASGSLMFEIARCGERLLSMGTVESDLRVDTEMQDCLPSRQTDPLDGLPEMHPPEDGAFDFGPAVDDNNYGDDDGDLGPGFAMVDDQENLNVELQNAGQQRKAVSFAPVVSEPQRKRSDPFLTYDGHQIDARKPCPLRKGRTIEVPPQLNGCPSDYVTGGRTRKRPTKHTECPVQIPVPLFACGTSFHNFVAARTRRRDNGEAVIVPKPIGATTWPEFEDLAKDFARRQAVERRKSNIRRSKKPSSATVASKTPTPALESQPQVEVDNDFNVDGMGDFDSGDADYDFNEDPGLLDGEGQQGLTNTGLATLDEAYGADDAGRTATATEHLAFEELCRAHLQKYTTGAELFAHETQLSQRVHDWQSRLAPKLEEESERPSFDIYRYGEIVMEKATDHLRQTASLRNRELGNETDAKVGFDVVAKECPQYEVCRLFLASLSLCNSGNILFSETNQGYSSLQFHVLKTEINRLFMEDDADMT